MPTARMEALSDGVFAIAITLLVLELDVPPGSEQDLLGALAGQWPSYLAYVVSFATIGAVWLAHSVITEYLDRATTGLIGMNPAAARGGVAPVPDTTSGGLHRRRRP